MKPRSVIATIEGTSDISLPGLKYNLEEVLGNLAEGDLTVSQISVQVVQQPKPKK